MQFTYWDLVLGVDQRIFAQASQPNNVILVTLMLMINILIIRSFSNTTIMIIMIIHST